MNAVATHNARPHSTDSSEIAKMVLVGVITVVLMAAAILGSGPSQVDSFSRSTQLMHDQVLQLPS